VPPHTQGTPWQDSAQAALVRGNHGYYVQLFFPDRPGLLPVMVQITYRAPR